MTEKNTGPDQAQTEIDQSQEEQQNMFTDEGIAIVDDLEETGGDSETETPDKEDKTSTPSGQDDSKAEELQAALKTKDGEIAAMKTQISDLNKAVHGFRQKEKEVKATEETPLTDAQIDELAIQYKDDIPTLMRIVRHAAEQSARKAGKETVDATTISQNKARVDGFLANKFPAIYTEGDPWHNAVEGAKREFGLEDSPYGDLLALGACLVTHSDALLENMEKDLREKITSELAEKGRKKGVKEDQLLSPKKGKTEQKSSLSSQQEETFNQMGLTGGARKAAMQIVLGNKSKEAA